MPNLKHIYLRNKRKSKMVLLKRNMKRNKIRGEKINNKY